MRRINPPRRTFLWASTALLMGLVLLPWTAYSQEEVASSIRRYKDREVSTGYYEEYEAKPRRMRPLVEVPGVSRGIFPYSPSGAGVRVRTRLSDSHLGIKFYEQRRCEDCHAKEAMDIHTVRANLTCRQCHGGEPIASIQHYYSPLNPIRKHAYVCSKCHQGSSASFASYIVHEPAAGEPATRQSFPVLYYAYWFMLVLLIGTLGFFIPHSMMVGLREVLSKTRKKKPESEATDKSEVADESKVTDKSEATDKGEAADESEVTDDR